jgi:neopullulanase
MPIDTPAWVRDAVFYQIFPDRFARGSGVESAGPLEPWDAPPTIHGFKGGDLIGIVDRMPYLEDLGVTALYLTPIFTSASNHRYHTDDYLTVDPLLGGTDALRRLLDAAHGRGMRVVLDGVFNHTGRGFLAFHHILENGIASPYLDWYLVDRTRLAAGRPLIAYPEPGHDHVGRDSMERLGYRAWWGLPALPKLNVSHPPVREHLLMVAEHWLRFGIDGWRLDVPGEIDDPPFWSEFRERCRAIRPDAYLVGELWREAPDWLAGDRFDATMNYPLAEAILGFTAGGRLDRSALAFHHEYRERVRPLDGPDFADELERVMGLYDPAVTDVQLNLIGSHDTPRFRTMAGGDREAIKLAVAIQMSLPGAPCIYYGDEIGLEGRHDPDNRRAFPEDHGRWDRDLLDFTRTAIHLRRSSPALRAGTPRILAAVDGAIVYERTSDGDTWVVGLNAGDGEARLGFSLPGAEGRGLEPAELPGWPSPGRPTIGPSGATEVVLAPRTGCFLRLA